MPADNNNNNNNNNNYYNAVNTECFVWKFFVRYRNFHSFSFIRIRELTDDERVEVNGIHEVGE